MKLTDKIFQKQEISVYRTNKALCIEIISQEGIPYAGAYSAQKKKLNGPEGAKYFSPFERSKFFLALLYSSISTVLAKRIVLLL